MNFTPFVADNNATPLILAIVLGVLLIGAGLFLCTKIRVLLAIIPIVLGFGVIFTACFVGLANDMQAKDHNRNIATENLKAKYDISEVYWDARETNSDFKDTQPHDLLVENDKNQQFIFRYRLNPETNEPFLIDMPVKGGESPHKPITANSLIRK